MNDINAAQLEFAQKVAHYTHRYYRQWNQASKTDLIESAILLILSDESAFKDMLKVLGEHNLRTIEEELGFTRPTPPAKKPLTDEEIAQKLAEAKARRNGPERVPPHIVGRGARGKHRP